MSARQTVIDSLRWAPRSFPGSVLGSAMLCVLAGCGGGSSGDDPAVAPTPVAPAPPATGLLTDAQLRTEDDPNEAIVDSDAAAWFAGNAKTVRSLTEDGDFSDLLFLDDLLSAKRLVLLGESSHGVEEYSQAKLRLIKYLHEQQGYDILAFEGGLFDCERSQEIIESGSPFDAMRSCAFGVWHTSTVLDLFEYVRSTRDTARPLRITGFDVQASGSQFDQRAEYTASLFAVISADRARDVRVIESDFRALSRAALAAISSSDPAMRELQSALPTIAADYAAIADELIANIDVITAGGGFTRRDVLVAAQYARTTFDYAEQISQQFEFESGRRARDRGMAENLIALSQTLYPDDKIIVWAHNAHLRHRGTGYALDANMGALVHNQLEDIMYTVGFYMYRGRHAFNDRSTQTVAPPMNRSLEAIFYSRRLDWLFLDLENAPATPGSEWIHAVTPTWSWGEFELPLQLADEYDGFFIIDTVTRPDYVD